MTDENRGVGGVAGPPWSVDLLADLHAGVLDDHEAAELWPRVNNDPEALAVIEALEATTADLASLALEPAPPMPAEYAARLDAALAAEASARQAASFPGPAPIPAAAPAAPTAGAAPVVDLAAARRKRNRRLGWGAGVLTAAAAAIVVLAVTLPGTTQETGTPAVAAPPPSGPSVSGDGSGAESLLGGAMGVRDFGPLQDEKRLDACVTAAGLDPDLRPVGIRPVNVGGKAGVLVIYTTGKIAQYRIVAFGADCGPGNPDKLFDKIVGKK